jgi:hypothetical protein
MPLLLLGLAMVMGCAKPPQEAIDSAKQAIEAARAAGAGDYAAESLRMAEDKVNAMNTELEAQMKKFALMRSFKNVATMAADAKSAGEKAVADAAAGKEKAKGEAEALLGQVKTALDEANALLATAPAGKGSQMDIEAMKSDLTGVATQIAEGEAAHAQGMYLQSKAKFEAAMGAVNNVKMAVQQAIDMKKGKKS